ncbi:MAG: glucose-1-phosphate cytidylyltransferase [Thiocapsa sp.]|uniref:glucose-1-phosphate cytidylyltransferase n=1 Tax=Thiocapsa sp. TaxID=2024551 RepID=UPI001BCE2340|nr:glucose-1-phosphate cytidylyltransferase [Thiocapsa sp.]QVL50313.1 MAG: glucose-1-phosphate cytidylyltransferase [Thiocapsa sp.]
MKTVIFAGGLGTRLSEETSIRPKPMVEVGNRPILWHIMKTYSAHGIDEFIICCGYKGYVIKEYFANYFLHMSDVTFDLRYNQMNVLSGNAEPWKISLIDTGENTMTGGRLKRVREHIGSETFCLTYGDGVSDVNITELIRFHRSQGSLATLTAVQPPGRFGAIALHEGQTKIKSFQEKPEGDGAWINGGYFVVEPQVIDLIEGDDTVWEQGPMTKLASMDQLSAFRHSGFWQPMDTLRDRTKLEELWAAGKAPWKVW